MILSGALVGIFFFIGLVAGIVESSAGGSGLIVLPTLLSIGLNPVLALGTSKLQYAFGALVSISRYHRAHLIKLPYLKLYIAISFILGALGALLLVHSEFLFLNYIIPILLLAAAVYFAKSPRIQDVPSKPHLKPIVFGFGPLAVIAFYDGFFGTGSASFYVLAMVWGLGLSTLHATACTKLIDFASGIAALAILIWHGQVAWLPGILLGLGQMIGAWLGAGLVIKKGTRFVKPLLITVTVLLSAKLLWDAF